MVGFLNSSSSNGKNRLNDQAPKFYGRKEELFYTELALTNEIDFVRLRHHGESFLIEHRTVTYYEEELIAEGFKPISCDQFETQFADLIDRAQTLLTRLQLTPNHKQISQII